jgi:subtilisin family serine protease
MLSLKTKELSSARDVIRSVCRGIRLSFSRTWLIHTKRLSVALAQPSTQGDRALEDALDYAVSRGAIPVAAAGNQGTLGSTVITRHPWVLPVVACTLQGRPIGASNLGSSLGRRGLMAPGEAITSLSVNGPPLTLSGTSAATPFVTGALALLWSAFPAATAAAVRYAVTHAAAPRRATVVPPLLDAWAAYHLLKASVRR